MAFSLSSCVSQIEIEYVLSVPFFSEDMTGPSKKTFFSTGRQRTPMRGRTVATLTAIIGVTVASLTLLLTRERILEYWYLSELEASANGRRHDLIDELGNIGSKRAWLAIAEQYATIPAGSTFRRQVLRAKFFSHESINHQFPILTETEIDDVMWAEHLRQALFSIENRLAGEDTAKCFSQAMLSQRTSPQLKILLAQQTMIYTMTVKELQEIPPALSNHEREWIGPFFLPCRDLAISVLVSFLRHSNANIRTDALYGIGLCGEAVKLTIPSISKLTDDPVEAVRIAAAGVLRQIREGK